MITPEHLKNWFTYHAPDEMQKVAYEELRNRGLDLAKAIVDLCPDSADTTAAVRLVRQAVMTANSAIACGGN